MSSRQMQNVMTLALMSRSEHTRVLCLVDFLRTISDISVKLAVFRGIDEFSLTNAKRFGVVDVMITDSVVLWKIQKL